MALSIRVSGFEDDGVRLIPPTSPTFDELARPLIGRPADIGLQLKPMLVIVSNESTRTIVSLSLWTVCHSDGRTFTMRSHASFPESVCGDVFGSTSQAIASSGRRIEAMSVVIHGYGGDEPYYDQFLYQFIAEKERLLSDATELLIGLDAVIFADGALVGRDQDHWLRDLFSEYVAEKQNWYRQILERLDAGMSVEEAYAPIRAFQAEQRERLRRPVRSGERLEVWKTQAAAEATKLRRSFTDDDLPAVLRKSIRLTPFVIRPK